MQTSRRRRTTSTMNYDNYDPKNKSKNGKQTIYIIAGIIGLVIGLLILYKLFSTSSPTAIKQTTDNNNYYENDVETDIVDEIPMDEVGNEDINNNKNNNNNPDIDLIPDIDVAEDMMNRNRKKQNIFGHKNKLFKNPLHSGRLSSKLEKDLFKTDRMRRDRAERGRRDNVRDRPNMEQIHESLKGRIGDLGDLQNKMNKMNRFGNMENYKKMMKKGPFNEMGEGPIFNALNEENGNTKLSPEQLHAAREKLKQNMRGMDGRFPGLHGLEGLRDEMKQKRRQEM